MRRRALERLTRQAQSLDANAVIGLEPQRRTEGAEGAVYVEYVFTGTAVHVERLQRPRDTPPLLTLASSQELWRLLEAGVEPVGIAGAFASVRTSVSLSSRRLTTGGRRWAPNTELEDLTKSAYEVRRLALDRLAADAKGLHASGLIGIDMQHQEHTDGRLAAGEITVHVLATAVRTRAEAKLGTRPIMRLGAPRRG